MAKNEQSDNISQTSSSNSSRYEKVSDEANIEEGKNVKFRALSSKRTVKFVEPKIPVEVEIKVSVLELRGIILDFSNSTSEKSFSDGAVCLDDVRACISVPSGTSNISTHFPSRPLCIIRKNSNHVEALASWANVDGDSSDDECHLTFSIIRVIGSDEFSTNDVAFMLKIISLPIALIHDGKMIPFGIAQLVISNLSFIPTAAALSVVHTGTAKERAIVLKTKRSSKLCCNSYEGHGAVASSCDGTKLLVQNSPQRFLTNKGKQLSMFRSRAREVTTASCKVKYPVDKVCALHVRIDVQRVLS